jgi:hypothetical protein
MMNFKSDGKEGLFKSIFTAYFILLLHVILLAGIGVTVVLFKGVYHYLPWIMGFIGIFILITAWVFYLRMKKSSAEIKDILAMPEFRDRTVEVTLLGGLASFKATAKDHNHGAIEYNPADGSQQFLIEDNTRKIEQKILELTALFKKDLITKEEFDKAKQNIIQG